MLSFYMKRAILSRKNFIKLGGLAVAGGFLAACNAEIEASQALMVSPITTEERKATATIRSTETQTAAFTTTPAPPTLTPAPKTTITAIPTVDEIGGTNGEILTIGQKQRLREEALKFVAANEKDAIQVARSLGYLKNDGHPASVCGPLAVAILRDARLISKYVDLHAFWLLNPRDGMNMKILERTFPRDEFTWYQNRISTAEFDFQAFPLKTGDFIYLYAGDPGSFEHMLTVSRVDEEGRAYSVTNYDSPEGYVIREVLLYDPTQPGVGKFYDWTNRKNYRYGLTGFGGFDLWRFAKPVLEAGPREEELIDAIDGVIAKNGGKWYVLIREIARPSLYAREIREPVHPASTIKVPIAMLFFHWLTKNDPQGLQAALKHGIDGRSFEQLLRAMLVVSEEKATESILKALQLAREDLNKDLNEWGTDTIDVTKRIASAHDMAILFEGLYGNFLSDEARQFILDALKVYTPGDDTRWGAIRKKLPEGYQFFNKRGTITNDFLVVADWAIVECPTSAGKKTFILGAFGFQGDQKTTYEELVETIEEMAGKFWKYVQGL
jgi:beta-lactamase class A